MSSERVANPKCDPALRGIHAHSTVACGFYPLQLVSASAQDVTAYITATKHTAQAEEVTLTGGAELSGGSSLWTGPEISPQLGHNTGVCLCICVVMGLCRYTSLQLQIYVFISN